MKKIIALVLALLTVIAVGTTVAFADENPVWATVNFTAPNTYILNIPMDIEVGTLADITVENINVANGDKIVITLNGMDNNGEVQLAHTEDSNSTVSVKFDVGGNVLTPNNNVIGWFSGDPNSETAWQLDSYCENCYAETKAGNYQGSVYFEVNTEAI